MKLSNNKQLYDYLAVLATALSQAGAAQLSESVLAASRTAWGTPATEFLGESRIVLRRVLDMDAGLLTEGQRSDLIDVLGQLDVALDER